MFVSKLPSTIVIIIFQLKYLDSKLPEIMKNNIMKLTFPFSFCYIINGKSYQT